ncbi:uncharacterized protein LOC108671084 [Hyalella azteca]|uniref:Uncharacterized protein LOC108671084 n=1 Tax=Hyalella azteca TaxID=294128 RepID=A0A8B7NK71_HYAAZ|nr:uncharacterized protein LOC108671084 [Hyalella azteca]
MSSGLPSPPGTLMRRLRRPPPPSRRWQVTPPSDYPDLRHLKAYTSTEPHATPAGPQVHRPGQSVCVYPFSNSTDNGISMHYGYGSSLLKGSWILYPSVAYAGTSYQYHGVNSCYNLTTSASINSLRYAGSPYGMDDVYFNLYNTTYFGGNEFTGNTNTETVVELDMEVSSLIVSGQSPWTFFTGLKFTGESVCVYPSYNSTDNGISIHYFDAASMSSLGLPDNSIRSVARGCLSDTVYRDQLQQFQQQAEEDIEKIKRRED